MIRMRALAGVATILLLSVSALGHVQAAPQQQPEETEVDEATKLARTHFKNGVKLYRDANYPGALAEFEAAYQNKPGAGSLQNVALCQKALFRYAESAATLELLLARHATELSDAEIRALKEAASELKALVGSILLDVQPADARVLVNGRNIPKAERDQDVRLNVGEHTVIAEAPGYARVTQVVRLAGGRTRLPVKIELKPTAGFLSIVATDPQAAIAVDGITRSFHRYRGPVEPDKPHLVQVFREGFEPFETRAEVELGKILEINVDLGPPLDDEDEDDEQPEPTLLQASGTTEPRKATDPRGFYGMLALTAMALGQHPLDLDVTESAGGKTLGAVGLRGGYRLWKVIAAELMLDYGTIEVRNASSPDDSSQRWNYELASTRFGGNLRLMTGGSRVRFTSTVGTGAVHHRVELTRSELADTRPSTTSAFDPYFSLELGIQFNFGHVLAEAAVGALIDGVGALQRKEPDPSKPFSSGSLPMIGIGLRGGWSSWKP